jgi:hypothetical protein
MDEMAWGIIVAGLTLFGMFGLTIFLNGQEGSSLSTLKAFKASPGKKAA